MCRSAQIESCIGQRAGWDGWCDETDRVTDGRAEAFAMDVLPLRVILMANVSALPITRPKRITCPHPSRPGCIAHPSTRGGDRIVQGFDLRIFGFPGQFT
jgi:hypothetical protein